MGLLFWKKRKPKIRILYSTVATSIVKHRLVRTHIAQQNIPGGLDGLDKILITEPGGPYIPSSGFRVIAADLRTNGKFNFSKYKNASMRYARDHGYDWLIQGDSDLVMLQPPSLYPESGLSSVMTYYCQPNENIKDLVARWKSGSKMTWVGTAYLLMSRYIFTNFSFCEQFYGYGYDDADFMNNVLWPEPHRISRADGTPFGARGIHIHDSTADQRKIYGNTFIEDVARNQALFEERRRKVIAKESL